MKRDIILVHPPQRGLLSGFATGLIDLANFISAREPSSRIIVVDLALQSGTGLIQEVERALGSVSEPMVVGITTTTASYSASLYTARVFKVLAPESIVVLGGHHSSPQHEVVLRRHRDIVDVVIRGEGERPLLALAAGAKPVDIPGCSVLQDGDVQANPRAQPLTQVELDSLPVNFDGLNFQGTSGKFDHTTYVSARGCPHRCSFCAVAGETIRAKSIHRVVDDILELVDGHDHRRIAIEDNFFGQNRKRVLALCTALEKLQNQLRTGFSWDCQTRVESVVRTAGVLDAFARAGCEGVYLGVESLHENELAYLGKTSRPSHYIDLVSDACDAILRQPYECYVNIQVGLPSENEIGREQRLRKLADLGRMARKYGREITVFPQLHVIYPGTQHFWNALQEKVFGRLGIEVFEAFTEWEAEKQPVFNFLGENFAHGVGGIPIGLLHSEHLRQSKFVIRDDAVGQLRLHLERLDELDGINLFKYGSYLATGAPIVP